MKRVGIIGAGTMGVGIAQVAATNGCFVTIFDANSQQAEIAKSGLQSTIEKLISKGKISQEQGDSILANCVFCSSLSDLAPSDLVIEAIVENKEIKHQVFTELESLVSETCILASNTSSISITSLASCLKKPERFIGIHFFNPAPLMPLVEIIPGLLTDAKLGSEMIELMAGWGKVPVLAKDIPGFIVNRIARPFYGEGLRIVEEGIATPEQVDDAMRSLGNFKMGPFELMDLIGVDVNFAVTKTVYQDYFYDKKYQPSLLQQRMSEAKLWGRKTGRGFYNYAENAENPIPDKNEKLYAEIFNRIIAMLINEAVEAKRLKVASDEDLDLAMMKGVNYPKGLLAWGEEIGFDQISKILHDLHETYQEERYRQSPLLRKLAN